MYSVKLTNWKLATGQCPILYTPDSYISSIEENKPVVSKEKLSEDKAVQDKLENARNYQNCMSRASNLKNVAGELFKKGEYSSARYNYMASLEEMQVVFMNQIIHSMNLLDIKL